jgi:hypothetical protein
VGFIPENFFDCANAPTTLANVGAVDFAVRYSLIGEGGYNAASSGGSRKNHAKH